MKQLTKAQKLSATRKAFKSSAIVTAVFTALDLVLQNAPTAIIVTVGVIALLAFMFMLLSGAAYFINYGQRDLKDDRPIHGRLAKTISVLVYIAVAVSLVTSVKALNADIADVAASHRFIYENTARIAIFSGALLTLWLDSLQTGIYFLSRNKRTMKLDERQARERQEIFEKSYKIGGTLAFLTVWFFSANSTHALLFLQRYNHASPLDQFATLPDMFYYPLWCLVLTLYALPLTIAAWRKKTK